ncbi:MAG: hypothetical protein KGN16_25200 [Burkholderiales bacterium]|nr:hypothetical protein [Burkholderiales bacterium]
MDRNQDHSQARLPEKLLEHVIWPVRVEAHHDDNGPASKWRGYDALGVLCWCRHRYSQWDAAFDDEDQPMIEPLREEEFEAWRSLTGDWVRRVQRLDGDGRPCGELSDSGFEVVGVRADTLRIGLTRSASCGCSGLPTRCQMPVAQRRRRLL